VSYKIYEGRKSQRYHREHGPAACKEINARCDANAHNCQTNLAIEIFLDIKSVMTAGYTGCNGCAVDDRVIYE